MYGSIALIGVTALAMYLVFKKEDIVVNQTVEEVGPILYTNPAITLFDPEHSQPQTVLEVVDEKGLVKKFRKTPYYDNLVPTYG